MEPDTPNTEEDIDRYFDAAETPNEQTQILPDEMVAQAQAQARERLGEEIRRAPGITQEQIEQFFEAAGNPDRSGFVQGIAQRAAELHGAPYEEADANVPQNPTPTQCLCGSETCPICNAAAGFEGTPETVSRARDNAALIAAEAERLRNAPQTGVPARTHRTGPHLVDMTEMMPVPPEPPNEITRDAGNERPRLQTLEDVMRYYTATGDLYARPRQYGEPWEPQRPAVGFLDWRIHIIDRDLSYTTNGDPADPTAPVFMPGDHVLRATITDGLGGTSMTMQSPVFNRENTLNPGRVFENAIDALLNSLRNVFRSQLLGMGARNAGEEIPRYDWRGEEAGWVARGAVPNRSIYDAFTQWREAQEAFPEIPTAPETQWAANPDYQNAPAETELGTNTPT